MAAIPPSKNTAKIVEEFIRYANQHLSTVSGLINTISVFPSAPSPITLPSIVNWSGYSVLPARPSFELNQIQESEINEVAEAEAIQQDINEEYPKSQKLYEAQFDSEEEALENNSDVSADSVFENVEQFEELKKSNNITGTGDLYGSDAPTPTTTGSIRSIFEGDYPTNTTLKSVGKGDLALLQKVGNGIWPTKGTAPNFEVSRTEKAGKKNGADCPRYWYVTNPEFLKKNCTELYFPTATKDVKLMVHKDLAAVIKPAIEKIKAAGLQKYIENCGGGLAIRNVTCGTRLSNHSWGTAIDMNTSRYPYGYKFKEDGIYVGDTKKRDLDDFDKGFLKVATIFQSVGMTWLKNNDPMHISIYE